MASTGLQGTQTIVIDGNKSGEIYYKSSYNPTRYTIPVKSSLLSRRFRTMGDQWKDGIPPKDFPDDWKPKDIILPDGGYSSLIQTYEREVSTSEDKNETLFKKIKKKTVDGTSNPNMRIIPANTIVRETGFHPDILCENEHRSTTNQDGYVVNDYVGHPLDPGSPLDSDDLFLRDVRKITIDESFFESFGFPPNIKIDIQRINLTEKFNVVITIDENPLSGTFERIKQNGATKWMAGGDLGDFLIDPGVSNKIKNKAYHRTEEIIKKKRILLIKELGDFLQVLLYFIWFLWETQSESIESKRLTWKKQHSMITTDSVVYNLCKDFGLQCTYTGSTESLTSGECTLYRYLPVEMTDDDYQKTYRSMTQYYLKEVIEYNQHIKFALNQILFSSRYTWGIPFMNSHNNTLIVIDGFQIQNLSVRSDTNGQSGRIREMIRQYIYKIDDFNTKLSNISTSINDSDITASNFNEKVAEFKKQPFLKENRTSVVLTSDGVVCQITHKKVRNIYYPCPGTIFYNDICSILSGGSSTGEINIQINRTTYRVTPLNSLSDALTIVLNNFTTQAGEIRGGMFGINFSPIGRDSSISTNNSSRQSSNDSSTDSYDSSIEEIYDNIEKDHPTGFYNENDYHEQRDIYQYLQNFVKYINEQTLSLSIKDIVGSEFYNDLSLLACMTYDYLLINPDYDPNLSLFRYQSPIEIPVYKYVSHENGISHYDDIDETTYWDYDIDNDIDNHMDEINYLDDVNGHVVVFDHHTKTPNPKIIIMPRETTKKEEKSNLRRRNRTSSFSSSNGEQYETPFNKKIKNEGGKYTKKINKIKKTKNKSSKKQKTTSRRTRKRHHKIK